jgi:hypothetical protein
MFSGEGVSCVRFKRNTLYERWSSRPASGAALYKATVGRSHVLNAKFIKSRCRSVLTEEHVTELVRTSLMLTSPSLRADRLSRIIAIKLNILFFKPEHY